MALDMCSFSFAPLLASSESHAIRTRASRGWLNEIAGLLSAAGSPVEGEETPDCVECSGGKLWGTGSDVRAEDCAVIIAEVARSFLATMYLSNTGRRSAMYPANR